MATRTGKPKTADPPLPHPERHNSRLAYANGIAAVFMFFSWLGQNFYQSEMSSQKADIQANFQFVNSEMSRALTWMLTFQAERRKDRPDPGVILNAAVSYAKTVQAIVAVVGKIDPGSPVLQNHIEDSQRLTGQIEAAARQGDIHKLEEHTSTLMAWFGSINQEARDAIGARVQAVDDDEDRGKFIFRLFFLLSSGVLAITWWKTNLSSLRAKAP